MEILLTNNIFFVYLLGILVIINYEIFEKRQKIAIIYTCSFGLTFNNELRCVSIIFLLLFILFLYEEYLNEDLLKVQYITKAIHKILDFLYMYMFQYKILYVIAAIALQSKICSDFFVELFEKNEIAKNLSGKGLVVLSILLLISGVHKMFNNPVELKNFEQINQKFSEYPYYHLPFSDEKKRNELFKRLELVAAIEDYTFFLRKKSYSFLSLEFVKIVISKKRTQNKISKEKRSSRIECIWLKARKLLSWRSIWALVKRKKKIKSLKHYICKCFSKVKIFFVYKTKCFIRSMKRYIRGYSTIEMQLMRILAYRKGLKMGKPESLKDIYLIATRKLYEIIYVSLFFSGYKKYLSSSKEAEFYRHYLVYIYLHTVQTTLNGKTYRPLDKIFGDVDVMEWPMEALFIIVLGLNNMRITRSRVEKYMDIIDKYQINLELVYQLVDIIQ